jgi:hypothetical protein
MNPDNQAYGSKYSWLLLSSRKDSQKSESSDFLLMTFRVIENLILLNQHSDKIRMFQTLLKGQALSYFKYHLIRRLEAEDSELPGNDFIELVRRELYIGLEYISKLAINIPKY